MKIIEKLNTNGGGFQRPNLLVIHAMSQFIDGYHASDYLQKIKLSSHYLIDVDGTVIKCRDENRMAWHAKKFNVDSLGIEVLVEGHLSYKEFIEKIGTLWVKVAQMKSIIELSNDIINRCKIQLDNVKRHSDIDPTRKHDPGAGFNWEFFKSKLITS